VYDVRELHTGVLEDEDRLVSPLVGSLEKERGVLVDDPRWQGQAAAVFRLLERKLSIESLSIPIMDGHFMLLPIILVTHQIITASTSLA